MVKWPHRPPPPRWTLADCMPAHVVAPHRAILYHVLVFCLRTHTIGTVMTCELSLSSRITFTSPRRLFIVASSPRRASSPFETSQFVVARLLASLLLLDAHRAHLPQSAPASERTYPTVGRRRQGLVFFRLFFCFSCFYALSFSLCFLS